MATLSLTRFRPTHVTKNGDYGSFSTSKQVEKFKELAVIRTLLTLCKYTVVWFIAVFILQSQE